MSLSLSPGKIGLNSRHGTFISLGSVPSMSTILWKTIYFVPTQNGVLSNLKKILNRELDGILKRQVYGGKLQCPDFGPHRPPDNDSANALMMVRVNSLQLHILWLLNSNHRHRAFVTSVVCFCSPNRRWSENLSFVNHSGVRLIGDNRSAAQIRLIEDTLPHVWIFGLRNLRNFLVFCIWSRLDFFWFNLTGKICNLASPQNVCKICDMMQCHRILCKNDAIFLGLKYIAICNHKTIATTKRQG